MTDKQWAEAIGAAVYAARKAAGLSQGELAEAAGVKQGNISRLEAGTHLPLLSTVRTVAEALGIHIHVLLVPPAKPRKK